MGRYVTYIDPTSGFWRHGVQTDGTVTGDDGLVWPDLHATHVRPAVRLVRGFEAQYHDVDGRWIRVETLRVQIPVSTEQGMMEASAMAYALLRDHYGLSEGQDLEHAHTGEEPPFAEVCVEVR